MRKKNYILLIVMLAVLIYSLMMETAENEINSLLIKKAPGENKKEDVKWVEVPLGLEIEKEKPKSKVKVIKKKKIAKKKKKTTFSKKQKKSVLKSKSAIRKKVAQKRTSQNSNKKIKRNTLKNREAKRNTNNGYNLLAKYKMPVEKYLRIMKDKGGIIVVYATDREGIVCELDPVSNRLISKPDTSEMSIRGRRITGDYPGSSHVIKKAETLYGRGSYELILLLPNDLDNLIYDKVSDAIVDQGLTVGSVTSVELEFSSLAGEMLFVRVNRILGKFGYKRIDKGFKI
ncbi:MAG: hypothetical protein CMI58_04555 [Parcubacteria group bacterium]|nr:hypothetical protein [Parcubacteria group bacterium]|tara:strand:+ start:584 stop:1444 length:861 start_codon:yes stop_codon:yes gene_type:complete